SRHSTSSMRTAECCSWPSGSSPRTGFLPGRGDDPLRPPQLAERVITAGRQEAGPQAGGPIPSLHQGAREAELLAEAVTSKLRREPIEDLRLDFEDGFGDQGDEFEDQWVAQAARDAVAGQNETGAPAFYGIRFKCLETPTRAR